MRSTRASGDLRVLAPEAAQRISANLSAGRAVPAICSYLTAVNHIKRYLFARDHLLPGSVIDCASGAGYGASLLSQSPKLVTYIGIDIDGEAVKFAQALNEQPNVEFRAKPLEQVSEKALNVVSLETVEHVADPHVFMEMLIDRLAVGGQLILSMPSENWAGSHLNPHHVTNWNMARFEHLLDSYFEHYDIRQQQLSFIREDTFGHSDIFQRPADPNIDETFVAIASKPRERRHRDRVVIRRSRALGDTILATPIAKAVKTMHPDRDVVFVTRHTEVLMNNPYVDIASTQRSKWRLVTN